MKKLSRKIVKKAPVKKKLVVKTRKNKPKAILKRRIVKIKQTYIIIDGTEVDCQNGIEAVC